MIEVRVNLESLGLRQFKLAGSSCLSCSDEMWQWLTKHDIPLCWELDNQPQPQWVIFRIDDPHKAMLFKLTWGGR